jgi:hypothetical protein
MDQILQYFQTLMQQVGITMWLCLGNFVLSVITLWIVSAHKGQWEQERYHNAFVQSQRREQ